MAAPKNKKTGVTHKEEIAIQEYLKTGSKTAAYRKAYSTKNMKPETIHRRAHHVFGRSNVEARIENLRQKLEEKEIMSLEEAQRILAEHARGEAQEENIVIESVGNFQSKARIIETKVKAKDRIKALEVLGKTKDWMADGAIPVIPVTIVDDL